MSWFHPDLGDIKTYCEECFQSDDFDATEYSRDFDFERPFFEQFAELRREVPRHISNSVHNENSEYIICAHRNKNCYFLDEVDGSWDCYYGYNIQYCKNMVECIFVRDSEIGYQVAKGENCYAVFYSQNVFHCSNSAFLQNCRGCKNCLFSANLRNKEYYIFNKKASKEEYEKWWKFIFSGSKENVEEAREKAQEFLKTQPFPAGILINTEDSTGNYLSNCKNVKDCYWVDNCRDCRYCSDIHYSRDAYDVNIYEGEMLYEVLHAGPKAYMNRFVQLAWFSHNVDYCLELRSCRNCFGCAGLKHKEFYILNKKYPEEEYYQMVEKIIEHMKGTSEWGEFFPLEMSPHPYNLTMAQRFYPLTKEEVEARGWEWLDEKEVKEFRVTDAEAEFYRRYGIPVPEIPPMERIDRLWESMGPRELRDRQCSNCGCEITTTYGPEFEGRVLCKECYLGVLE